MDDLISRQAAIDALGGNEPVGDPSKMDDDDVVKMWERIRIINIINKLPSAQPERKTGRWVSVGCVVPSIANVPMIKCTVCGHLEPDVDVARTPYCSHCGSRMGGDTE